MNTRSTTGPCRQQKQPQLPRRKRMRTLGWLVQDHLHRLMATPVGDWDALAAVFASTRRHLDTLRQVAVDDCVSHSRKQRRSDDGPTPHN